MDLSAFNSGGRSRSNASGIKGQWNSLKTWLYPVTKDKRKERMGQYKDISIFLGAIIAVVVFEDKIKKFM